MKATASHEKKQAMSLKFVDDVLKTSPVEKLLKMLSTIQENLNISDLIIIESHWTDL